MNVSAKQEPELHQDIFRLQKPVLYLDIWTTGYKASTGTEKEGVPPWPLSANQPEYQIAATKSLFLNVARHKDAQSGCPSWQLAIYNKFETMLMMSYDRACTGFTCNSK
jgi:hypothetical protein